MKNQLDTQNKKQANDLAKAIFNGSISADDIQDALKGMPYSKKQVEQKPHVRSISDTTVPDTPDHVGIWKRDVRNENLFVRDEAWSSDFIYWADKQEIRNDGDQLRIVFLGESVARGYLLDPEFNPCIAMRNLFDQAGFDVEIIDLARTNCSIGDLKVLSKQCKALHPDGIVIFGGNNWIINSQNTIDASEITEIVNDITVNKSHEVFRQIVEGKLEQGMNELFGSLNTIKTELGIPVFIINPEFNLLDWRSNDFEQIPLFHSGNLEKWYDCLEKVKGALKKQDYNEVENLGAEMIELYPTNPLGYEMLAEAMLINGDTDGAIAQYRKALGTTIFQTSHCPGATSYIQDKIREATEQHSFHLVDLPALFKQHLKGGVADKTLFLDYCHLTIEGTNVAMAGLVREVLAFFGNTEEFLPDFGIIDAAVDRLGVAKGHFLAAIHNAHWGQRFEVIFHHCKMALSEFDISKEMMAYVFSVNSICPWRLNKNFEELVSGGVFSHYLLMAQQEDGVETLDILLTEAILKALQESGIDHFEAVRRFRISEHFSHNQTVDLLKSQYWSDFNYNLNMKLKNDTHYTEFFQFSQFHLICEKNENLHLDLVHKLPYDEVGVLEVFLNGEKVLSSTTSGSWSKEVINLPSELLTDGINSLRIKWPLTHVTHKSDSGKPLQYADVDLLHEYMYPVIGKIHSLSLINSNKEKETLSAQYIQHAEVD
ncbi:MAG: hypothetical protein AAFO69_01955 [Bacteroidota bacterium]